MATNWRLSPREVYVIAKALQELAGTQFLISECKCNELTGEEVADLAARFAGAACSKRRCECQTKTSCNCRDCC